MCIPETYQEKENSIFVDNENILLVNHNDEDFEDHHGDRYNNYKTQILVK